MIKLTPEYSDALVEVCNIGMCKAAKQLSLLLNSKIDITIPAIDFMNADKLNEKGFFETNSELSFVYQNLVGDFEGRASLIIQTSQTKHLTEAIFGHAKLLLQKEERINEQEAMVEIGNIIISACISSIVNMLNMNVSLSIPVYKENNLISLMPPNNLHDIFIIKTNLTTIRESVSGNLLLVLTSDSIKHLIHKLKKLMGDIG